MKYKLFKILTSVTFVLPVGLISACALATANNLEVSDWEKEIPPEMLNISEDGKMLYGFNPDVTADDIRLGGYNVLKIPDNVEEIKPYAFAYMFDGFSSNVTTLKLSKNIKKIGKGAFTNCYGFTGTLDISDKQYLEVIEQDAFNYCPGFVGVLNFPDSLLKIGTSAFRDCQKITGLCFNQKLQEIGNYAFDGCVNVIQVDLTKCFNEQGIQYLPTWAASKSYAFNDLGTKPEAEEPEKQIMVHDLTVPEEEWLKVFKDNLNLPEDFEIFNALEVDQNLLILNDDGKVLAGFKQDADLSKFNLLRVPESVTKIDKTAFSWYHPSYDPNYKLQIIFNDKLQEIGSQAFWGNTGFVGPLNLPAGLTKIDDLAFYEAPNFTGTVVIPKGVTDLKVGYGGQFYNCVGLSGLVIPKEFEKFGVNSFAGCTGIRTLDLSGLSAAKSPSWDYDTTYKPFSDWKAGEIILPWGAEFSVVDNFFKYALIDRGLASEATIDSLWLRTMNFHKGKAFPYHPEQPVEGISYIVNGDELRGLRKEIRAGEELIKTDYEVIDLPSGISSIYGGAFDGVFKPDTSSGQDVHQTNWKLRFNHGVKDINSEAFKDCSGIVGEVVLPNSLERIFDGVFNGCSNISSITLPKSLTEVHQCFKGCSRLKYIDCSQYTSVPDWLKNGTNIFADMGADGGIMLVGSTNSTFINQWKQAAQNQGLPSNWEVKGIIGGTHE